MQKLHEIFELIVKSGIQNAQLAPQSFQKRAGGIFIVREKEHFYGAVKGHIVTSYEQLHRYTNKATHWTPNVFKTYRYTNKIQGHIAGFEENELLQVNTFVVDIDTKQHSIQDILMACIDNSMGAPTMILETPSGYQVYFVLSMPIFMSNKQNGLIKKLVKVASENIKKSLREVDADTFCNDFGFFRMPNSQNIVWCQLNQTYTPDEVLSWSYDYSDGQDLYAPIQRTTKTAYCDSDWYKALTSITGAKGSKGAYGRNNLLFTIALANFADGVVFSDAEKVMLQVNDNLQYPLDVREVLRTLESAYSGKYSGPKREYVEDLLALNNIRLSVSFGGWYKHKKERTERTRVHLNEWEEDLLSYIQKCDNHVCELSQSALSKAIGIPRSTLNELIEKSTKLFKRATGTGRNAKTMWYTISYVFSQAMKKVRDMKKAIQFVYAFIRAYHVDTTILQDTIFEEYVNQTKLSTVPLHISSSVTRLE